MEETLELQQQIVRLQALFEASRRIHSTIQMDEVLRCALDIVVRQLEMEGAFYTAFPFSEGRIPPRYLVNPASGSLARGCVAFPLLDKAGATISDLVVIPRQGAHLTLEESDFLESLAVQTAVAIENARHHERALQMQRVEFDLASARDIQRSLLPQNIKEVPGYKIALRSISCYEVGGDYLDIVALPSGEQVMIVADVAGKGMASAMIASSFRAAFRAMATTAMPLAEIALRLNALHFEEGMEARRRYVTAVFFRLDPAQNTLECVNAGHNPALLWTGGTKKRILLEASSTPIGMLPVASYTSELHHLKDGARLLAFTDGLTEIMHGDEEFGEERLPAVTPPASAADVAVFACTSNDLGPQYSTTFTGTSSIGYIPSLDAGAAAYTDTLVRNGTIDQASAAAQKSMSATDARVSDTDKPPTPQVCTTTDGKTTCH